MAAALAEVRMIASELRAATAEHRAAIEHLRGIPADSVIERAKPSTVARKVAEDYRRQGEASRDIRKYNAKW
jgi:hypothetical protein